MAKAIRQHAIEIFLAIFGSIGLIVALLEEVSDAFSNHPVALSCWSIFTAFIGAFAYSVYIEISNWRKNKATELDKKLAQIENAKADSKQKEKEQTAERKQADLEKEQLDKDRELFMHMDLWLKTLCKALCTKPEVIFIAFGSFEEEYKKHDELRRFVDYCVLEEMDTPLYPKERLLNLYQESRDLFDLVPDDEVEIHRLDTPDTQFEMLYCSGVFYWGWREAGAEYTLKDIPF